MTVARLLRPLVLAALGALAALAAPPAQANDSSAELAGGGLRLTYNPHVRMESEDLYVSRQEVRVDYVFRNVSGEPQDTLVAFPLPEIDGAELGDSDIGIASADPVNFVDFRVWADGAPVAYRVEERASLLGIDVTARLRALGVPLNPMAHDAWQKLLPLPAATRRALAAEGLAVVESEDFILPQWRYGVVFYWRQAFPPGAPVRIRHVYRPVAGATVWYGEFFTDPEQVRTFCIEPSFARAAQRQRERAGDNWPSIHWVSYILTTGANWAGPIGRFRLTVDKGAPEHLVSLCRDGIRKTGPTTFVWEATDFWPESDLKVLFVEAPR